jgi:hypothetical protein
MIVVSGDGRVGAVSLGFGGQRIDENAAEESAHGWYQQQHPDVKWMIHHRQPGHRRFTARPRCWAITGENAQRIMLRGSRGDVKGNRADARHNAHQARQRQHPNLIADAAAANYHDLREPTRESP